MICMYYYGYCIGCMKSLKENLKYIVAGYFVVNLKIEENQFQQLVSNGMASDLW